MSSFEPDRPQVSGSSAPRTESAPDGGGAAPWSHVTTGGGGPGGVGLRGIHWVQIREVERRRKQSGERSGSDKEYDEGHIL